MARAESIPPAPFLQTEKTTFAITYLGATAGSVDLEVAGPANALSVGDMRFVARARTDLVFSFFYRLENTYESQAEAQSGQPKQFTARLDESKQSGTTVQRFDETKGRVHILDNRERKKKEAVHKDLWKDAPVGTHDVVSALFFVRRLPLAIGKVYEIPVLIGEEVHQLRLLVESEEELPTKIGKLASFVIRPSLLKGGVEKSIPESYLWIGKEGTRPILKIKAKVKIGSVIAYLRSYESGKKKAP